MDTPFLKRVAQTVPDAGAICSTHDMLLWSSSAYAAEVRQQSVYSAAAPDPRWSWPTSEELGRCVAALFGEASVAAGTVDSVPALVAQLQHPDPCFRLDAISKLGELEVGAAEAAGAIGAVAANRDELPRIRQAAMEAGSEIWGILAHGAARRMAAVMWDAGDDMTLRRAAVSALSAIGTCGTTNALEDLVLDETVDSGLRVFAAEAIDLSASNNALEALEEIRDLTGRLIIELAQKGGAGIDVECNIYAQVQESLLEMAEEEQ